MAACTQCLAASPGRNGDFRIVGNIRHICDNHRVAICKGLEREEKAISARMDFVGRLVFNFVFKFDRSLLVDEPAGFTGGWWFGRRNYFDKAKDARYKHKIKILSWLACPLCFAVVV